MTKIKVSFYCQLDDPETLCDDKTCINILGAVCPLLRVRFEGVEDDNE